MERDPITIHRYSHDRMVRLAAWDDSTAPWLSGDIDQESCYASFEEFRPDEPADYWHYWYDEVTYAISGRCEATVKYPPSFNGEHRVALGAGDLFLVKTGWSVRFDVVGEEPFVHVVVQLPRARNSSSDGSSSASFTGHPRGRHVDRVTSGEQRSKLLRDEP